MSQPFLGEIRMFGGNFAPKGWALCSGQVLSIAQNTALFSLLGVTYGGNGQTTFALPDLRGRFPMHAGNGPGLSPRTLGEIGGSETVTLLSTQMPTHNHAVNASSLAAGGPSPEGGIPGYTTDSNQTDIYAYSTTPNTTMSPQMIGLAGGSQPHENEPPFQVVNFIIALQGIFPSRN